MSNQEQVVLNGRYELHRPIGRGGMAEVFLARDQLLDRLVAIKMLFPEFASDPAFVARFRREAQSAANLNHPNIVGVYDWGKESSTYYIVMEYIDGQTLAEVLRAEGPLEPHRAADIASSVAAALGFAHGKGVVHRDIKPGNVLITAAGQVKVADFGIARAITDGPEENLTQTGSVMGTATYFSPEQAQGRPVDQRSDIYSLGVVLYEMACGRAPFQGDSPVSIAYKHVQETPPALRELNPAVPEGYDAITRKALAKNPANRYATAEDLHQDLERFNEGQQVRAEPVMAPLAPGPGTAVSSAMPWPVPPPDDPPPPPRRRGWFLVLLIALLAVLAGLVYAFARTLGAFDDTATVTVPVLRDRTVAEARMLLAAEGLESAEELQPSDTVAAGLVVSTDPAAGEQAEEGSVVRVVISSGAAQATIPALEGQAAGDALQTLRAAGFTDVVTAPVESDRPRDVVVRTEPGPGSVPTSQRITVFVSSGPAPAPSTTTAPPRTTIPPPRSSSTSPPPPTTVTPTSRAPSTTRPTTTTTTPSTTTTTTRPTTTTSTTLPTTTTPEEPPDDGPVGVEAD